MKFVCPLCNKKINDFAGRCEKLIEWFSNLDGKGLWRIRYLNHYEYQFLTDEDFLSLQSKEMVILDEANHWQEFDPKTLSGVNSVGQRTSIFS
ncbi:hypothetical protein [Tepidibacillus sp. HK-1]|uniref:hypothetical protein n=1 Tax=Tepidibacillus sp. HK-1 TaxID=1883407 RepID=UPI000852D8E6|nr:hypothetical protein [Tepidibacillus sp. HK-1]GBF10216.1 hypothetical protein HK1_00228 [Tepidibacillus sp. HK-1]